MTAGTLQFEGTDVTGITGKGLAHFRTRVQVVFQDPSSSLNPRHTVERIIAGPLHYQGIKAPQGSKRLIRILMDRVGLNPDFCQRYPGQFSGGQAQRIGIAHAVAVDPKLMVCDEAVSALDVSVQARVIILLRSPQRAGSQLRLHRNDLAVVRQIADRVTVMNQGVIVEQGDRDSIFDNPEHAYARSLLAAVPQINPDWDRKRLEMIAAEGAKT